MDRVVLRFARLQFGLFLFALSIAVMLGASIGLDPWSAVHGGLSDQTGLSFGRVTQFIGLALIGLSWVWLGVRPGAGTVFNMLVIGPWIDLLRGQGWVPVQGTLGALGVVQFLAGIAINGIATGVYIGARFGAGPRDGFVLGLATKSARSVRVTRIGIEVTLLVAAFLLGGSIGLGTLLFALLMGPAMQASLRIMGVSTDPNARRATDAAVKQASENA